jgi:hypothetical protein
MAEDLQDPLRKEVIIYSAPSDNACAAYGGCAVPISESQLYPPPDALNPKAAGKMELNDFKGIRIGLQLIKGIANQQFQTG